MIASIEKRKPVMNSKTATSVARKISKKTAPKPANTEFDLFQRIEKGRKFAL